MRKKRVNFYMPIPLLARLQKHSLRTCLTVSDLTRRAVEMFLDLDEKKHAPTEHPA